MNKKILLILAFFIAILSIKAQQCQNLAVEQIPSTCIIPFTQLNANFLNVEYRDSDTYIINAEVSCLPDLSSTVDTGIVQDDDWTTAPINLGFTFCFYGNMYDQIIVSDNGKVSFDLDRAGTDDNNWRLGVGDQLPNINWQPNCIFGPFFDSNSNRLPVAERANAMSFKIYNQDQTIPENVGNRVFVISFNSPSYGGGCSPVADNMLRSTITLYESSNVIDIEIREKNVCTSWNNGRALVGIQNKSATRGMSPAGRGIIVDGVNWDPRRTGFPNNMTIDAPDGELWRFVPDGDLLDYNFTWFVDNGSGYEFYSGDPSISVNPLVQTDYKAVLTYQGECSFTPIVLSEVATVIPPTLPNVGLPGSLTGCQTTPDSNTSDFILDLTAELLADYPTSDWANFNITYHLSQADADNNANPIATPFNSIDGVQIYIRIEATDNSACYTTRSFTLTVLPLDDSTFTYPIGIVCGYDTNPIPNSITTPNGIFIINPVTTGDPDGTIDSATGEIDLALTPPGEYTVTYTTTSNCPTSTDFNILINVANADDLDNVIICYQYVLPTLTNGDFYTGPNGTGTMLSTGDVITDAFTTLYVYAESGTVPNCTDDNPFTITVENVTATMPDEIHSCNNGDNTATFNISNIGSEIIGTQNVTLTYHTTLQDATDGVNSIQNISNIRTNESVFARIENPNGCFDTVEVPLVVDLCLAVIPQGFSPNSQIEQNRTFDITNIRDKYPNFTISIYNRLGNQIYSGDISKEDWNGKDENVGDLLPVGTYFYELKLNNDQDLKYRGWVYLQQ